MVVQILNVGLGNLSPLFGMLDKIPVDFQLVKDAELINKQEPIIIPGNANARLQCLKLIENGFDKDFFATHQAKIVGICSGAQVLLETTEEGGDCLGAIPGRSVALPSLRIGWFEFRERQFYFVHRYKMITEYSIANSESDVCAAFRYKHFIGLQFHPEKSGANGVSLVREVLSDA